MAQRTPYYHSVTIKLVLAYTARALASCCVCCLLLIGTVYGQYNNNWCIGDSLRLNFSTSPPKVTKDIHTRFYMPGTTVSDSAGKLLFYVTDIGVFSKDGTEIVGAPFAPFNQDDLILSIPSPRGNNQYYIFTSSFCYPSFQLGSSCINSVLIDFSNGHQIVNQYRVADSIFFPPQLDPWPYLATIGSAVKHANGKDWWIIYPLNHTDSIFTYRVTSQGIEGPFINVMNHYVNLHRGNLAIQPDGSRFFITSVFGVEGVTPVRVDVSEYSFDRCTGKIKFVRELGTRGFRNTLSADGTKLYLCDTDADPGFLTGTAKLVQYDLNSGSKTVLWENTTDRTHSLLNVRLGPDGKVYAALGQHFLVPQRRHPYNEYLSVIHHPDSPGLACDFRLDDLSLAPGFTHWHLPNIPNFDLGPLALPGANAGEDVLLGPCEDVIVELGTEAQPHLAYSWSPDTGLIGVNTAKPLLESNSLAPGESRSYVLTVIDTSRECRNMQFDTVLVRRAPMPEPPVPLADLEDCPGREVTLGGPALLDWQYRWSPAEYLDDAFTAQPVFTLGREQQVFTVEMTSPEGCIFFDTVLVSPSAIEECDLFIPNTFTPNGDGINEAFYIPGLPSGSRLEVYNRWGVRVFFSENYSQNWNAEGLPEGTYHYLLRRYDGQIFRGYVLVIR